MSELTIEIDTAHITSGEQIQGTVNLIVNQELPGKRLLLILNGKEKTLFRYQSTSGKYFKEFSGKHKIPLSNEVLYEWPFSPIPRGKYSFPFTLPTSATLPGTFFYKTSKSFGQIQFHLKARLENVHRIGILRTKQEISIIQCFDISDDPVTEFSTPLLTCNCFHRGFCNTTIALDKPVYHPGETCEVRITVDNLQAKVDIDNLECILWLVCRFISSEKKVNYFRKCIFFFQHQQAIRHKETREGPKEIVLAIPLTHEKIDMKNCGATFGNLIQCTYNLQVTLEFGSIIVEEPDMQMPVHIVRSLS
jgi:hypothetical protein